MSFSQANDKKPSRYRIALHNSSPDNIKEFRDMIEQAVLSKGLKDHCSAPEITEGDYNELALEIKTFEGVAWLIARIPGVREVRRV